MAENFTAKNLSFTVIGVEQVQSAIAKCGVRLKRYLRDVANISGLNISRMAKKAAPVGVSGQLRAQIHTTNATEETMTAVLRHQAKHSAWVEFGTGPYGARTNRQPIPDWYSHGGSHKQPPVEALVLWVMRKRLDTKFGLTKRRASSAQRVGAIRAAAFLVARSIARRGGNRAQPFYYPAAAAEEKPFLKNTEKVIRKALAQSEGKGKPK